MRMEEGLAGRMPRWHRVVRTYRALPIESCERAPLQLLGRLKPRAGGDALRSGGAPRPEVE